MNGVVLLVDDESAVRRNEARRLQRLGLEVLTAADSDEALALLERGPVDLLIADIQMPGNRDLSFTRAATARWPGLPLLLFTGNPSFETAHQAIGLGVRAYLLKPVENEVLEREVGAALEAGRLHRAVVEARGQMDQQLTQLARAEALLLAGGGGQEAARGAYLEVMLAQAAAATLDLCRFVANDDGGEAEAGVGLRDLVILLQETVEVLDRTRQHFKSKELGQLRLRLSEFLTRLKRPPAGA
jgi:DNA-binding NarL/FixJ family response regulator